MTKTRRQVEPNWEGIYNAMVTLGDLRNEVLDPNVRPPFNQWSEKLLPAIEQSEERDEIGMILEGLIECRDIADENEKYKHMFAVIKTVRMNLRYIKTGIPPSKEAPAIPAKSYGDFEYRDEVVYCLDEPMKLSKQSKKIMKLLIERSSHKISAVEVYNIDDESKNNHNSTSSYDNFTVNNRMSTLRRQLRKKVLFPGDEVIPLIPGTMPSEYALSDAPVRLKKP
jgi:hypothetical protein